MTLTTDSKGRLTCRQLFGVHSSYEAETDASGRIILTKLVKSRGEAEVVKPVRRHGLLVIPMELDEEALDREIREDREAINAALLG